MFVCKITCPACTFEGPEFVEGHSMQRGTYAVVLASSTGVLRVVEIAEADLGDVDGLTDAQLDRRIDRLAKREGGSIIETRFGEPEDLAVSCPECAHRPMRKTPFGIE